MDESNELYLSTPSGRLFRKAAIPGAISMLAATLFNLIDGIFIGQVCGDLAFAAANLAFPFTIIDFALAEMIGTGSSVPISISLGKGEEQKANNCFSCACILIVLAGFLVGGLFYFGAEPIMGLMGADGELQQMAADFLKVYAFCSPVVTMTYAVDNYLRICGKNKMSMFLNILNYGLNILLDFTFLVVLKWPVWSAALATCISMMASTIIGMVPFALRRFQLRFCRPVFSGALFKQIAANGSPPFLNTVSGRLVSIAMNMALMYMGGPSAIVIFGVMMYCGDIVQPLLMGVCDTVQPAIGYNYGAGRIDRVREIEKYILTTAAVISVVATVPMLLVPKVFAGLFLQPDELILLDASARVIRIFALTFVTRWFGFAIQSLFTALEKPIPATVLSLGYACVVPLVLMGLLWNMGLDGLWFNSPLTSLLISIAAGLLIIRAGKIGLFKQK